MEGLLVVIGGIVLAIPVVLIYLLISHSGVKSRLEDVEKELALLRRTRGLPVPSETDAPAGATIADVAPQVRPEPSERPKRPEPPAAAVIAARQAAAAKPPTPSRATEWVQRLSAWLADNWFYAVSALSLALAGLFLVQYGVENGLLPPAARVAAALVFGAVLIGAGEYIRRRFGDGEDTSTAYLPSVFSGAGIVSLFGGVLSARLLYDLIGPETALVGMMLVALVALVLGWFYGPLLAAVGVIGAFAAPFVVGGSSDDPTIFYGYFAIIAALGLGIDTLKRWAWVSVLSLVLAYVAGWLLVAGADHTIAAFVAYVFALALMALLIPARSVMPDHSGVLIHQLRKDARPIFPTLLSVGALGVTVVSLVMTAHGGVAEFWLSILALALLAGAWTCWSVPAPALQDQTLLPLAGLGAAVALIGLDHAEVVSDYLNTYVDAPEAKFPWAVSVLVAIGAVLSLLAAWRSMRGGAFAPLWAAAAAVIAPGLAVLIEVTWRPALAIGAYPWALHAAALALMMGVMAERFARVDGPEHRLRTAFFVLSALSCITFALVLILSLAALTAAIAVTVVVAAWLDRRFDLPQMGWFVAAGVATLGYRLVVDPGLIWAIDVTLPEMLLAHGSAFAAMVAGLWLLRPRVEQGRRDEAVLILDSAAWSFGGILLTLLVYRAIASVLDEDSVGSHWAMGLFASIWFGLALAQAQRMARRPVLRWVRAGLATVFALTGLGALALGAILLSPLLSSWFADVAGPPVVNTLAPAYLAPALVLALGVWRIDTLPRLLRLAMAGLAGALGVLWLFCVIRHFWQGPDAMELDRGMGQGELYTYTVALLLAGAALFYQSMAANSALMRRAGLVVIGLAVAKVFLIDISGLGGLVRVFSLLVLGLSLAGLAWLNRWAQGKTVARAPEGG
ncbi:MULTISPECIES: DUF2339 domain-containing protein [Roseobacteraceae]|uniref:DUF2339 domain-containing protein n=1 Tax=Pseudosulfitobacter pseudonitzschiae TaxID=1402135 RepID=A0A221K1X8_9RHOB|nr:MULTISPECIES: DUF2339 domain-containing protein [Roseobacteraceae]ASM73022.1 hypothetical protein SULPSESMR1_02221 [Pseudosulfitobacter pseudonitzschiae]